MTRHVTDPADLESLIERVGLVGKEAVEEAVRAERDRCLRLAEIYRGSDALRLAIQEGFQPKERG